LYRTNFAKINNIGTTDNFSVRVLPYVLRNGTSGDTIRTSNVNRTWMIDEDIAGGSNGTVEMFWNASDELPGFDRTASRTAHFISNWQLSNPGNASVDTNGIFSRAQAGYTSFSPFTVTSGTTVLIPLRFIEFTAVPNGKDVLLKWITEAEQNTSHFDVEFSTDGAGFTAIGKVNSANTGGEHRYEFTHQSPPGNTLYYRIRQVDLDGRYQYSKVIRVNLITATTTITLSPNPARISFNCTMLIGMS
jgi:predicted phage tail protein